MFGNCCGKSPVIEEMNSLVDKSSSPMASVLKKTSAHLTVDTSAVVGSDGDDDDVEMGGMSEPPVTPIGRDELALRRHRFFNDLMAASQGIHRVRFDPRGPSFPGNARGEKRMGNWDIFRFTKIAQGWYEIL